MSDTVTTNEVVEEVPKEQGDQKEEAKEAHVNGNDDAATNEENLHPLGRKNGHKFNPSLFLNRFWRFTESFMPVIHRFVIKFQLVYRI